MLRDGIRYCHSERDPVQKQLWSPRPAPVLVPCHLCCFLSALPLDCSLGCSSGIILFSLWQCSNFWLWLALFLWTGPDTRSSFPGLIWQGPLFWPWVTLYHHGAWWYSQNQLWETRSRGMERGLGICYSSRRRLDSCHPCGNLQPSVTQVSGTSTSFPSFCRHNMYVVHRYTCSQTHLNIQ